jgi:hypothetical protein
MELLLMVVEAPLSALWLLPPGEFTFISVEKLPVTKARPPCHLVTSIQLSCVGMLIATNWQDGFFSRL